MGIIASIPLIASGGWWVVEHLAVLDGVHGFFEIIFKTQPQTQASYRANCQYQHGYYYVTVSRDKVEKRLLNIVEAIKKEGLALDRKCHETASFLAKALNEGNTKLVAFAEKGQGVIVANKTGKVSDSDSVILVFESRNNKASKRLDIVQSNNIAPTLKAILEPQLLIASRERSGSGIPYYQPGTRRIFIPGKNSGVSPSIQLPYSLNVEEIIQQGEKR